MPGVKGTMEEFETGRLHSGSKTGPIVTNRRQAVAIGLSEEGKKVAAGGYGRNAMRKAAKVNPHGGYAEGGKVSPKHPSQPLSSPPAKPIPPGPGDYHRTYAGGGEVQPPVPQVVVTGKKMTQAEKDEYDRQQAALESMDRAKPGAPGPVGASDLSRRSVPVMQRNYSHGGYVWKAPAPLNEAAGGPAPPTPTGPVAGPGGPKTDSIPANLSNGEFIIPAEVTNYLGEKFFTDLVNKAHAEMQASGDNPFADLAGGTPGDMTGMTGP